MDTSGQLGRVGEETMHGSGVMLADKLEGGRTEERPRNKPCFSPESIYHKELRCFESICLQIKT